MTAKRPSLDQLEKRDDFVRRHIGPNTPPQTEEILEHSLCPDRPGDPNTPPQTEEILEASAFYRSMHRTRK